MIKKIEKLIIILWLYLMCYNFAFSQFNLENIFLKYAYSPDALDDVAFFSKEEKCHLSSNAFKRISNSFFNN